MAETRRKRKNVLPGLCYIGGFIQIGKHFGLLPYSWDWSSNEMHYHPSWRFRVIHGIWFLALSSYGAFLIKNCVVIMQDEGASAHMKIQIAYWTCTYLALDFGFLLNMRTLGQHHVFVNQLMSFATRVDRNYGLKIKRKVLNTVLLITIFSYIVGCTNVLTVFSSPKSHRLLTSLWKDPQNLSMYSKLLLFWVHLILYVGQVYHLIHNEQMLITYVFLVLPSLSRLRWHRTNNRMSSTAPFGNTRGIQLSPLESKQLFNQILVLQASFKSAYSGWVLLIMVCLLFVSVMNVFQAVVFYNLRALMLATCGIILMKACFKASGDVYEMSKEVTMSWTHICTPVWFPRCQRAARAARVPIGSAFYFDRGIMLTLMDIVVTTASNMIISYKQ